MIHHYVPSEGVDDPGFWAAGHQTPDATAMTERVRLGLSIDAPLERMPTGRVLVDVATRGVQRQTRLLLSPETALRLAADLFMVGTRDPKDAGILFAGRSSDGWILEESAGDVTVTFRNDGSHWLDAESTLLMKPSDAVEMALEIVRHVTIAMVGDGARA